MASLLDLLARNPLFAELSPAGRLALARQTVERRYAEGELVVACGEVWPYLLLLSEGSLVAMAADEEGEGRPFTTIEVGDLFWGQALFRDGAPMLVSLVAREDSCLYLWPQECLLPAFSESPAALWALCGLLAGRFEWTGQILNGFAYQPVAGRLGARTDDGRVAGELTLAEMASWARTSRPVVLRMLHRFCDQGLIRLSRAGLFVLDRDGLEHLAQAG